MFQGAGWAGSAWVRGGVTMPNLGATPHEWDFAKNNIKKYGYLQSNKKAQAQGQ